jgi:hypothetical protein
MRFQATVSERQVGGEIFCLPEAKAIQAADMIAATAYSASLREAASP